VPRDNIVREKFRLIYTMIEKKTEEIKIEIEIERVAVHLTKNVEKDRGL